MKTQRRKRRLNWFLFIFVFILSFSVFRPISKAETILNNFDYIYTVAADYLSESVISTTDYEEKSINENDLQDRERSGFQELEEENSAPVIAIRERLFYMTSDKSKMTYSARIKTSQQTRISTWQRMTLRSTLNEANGNNWFEPLFRSTDLTKVIFDVKIDRLLFDDRARNSRIYTAVIGSFGHDDHFEPYSDHSWIYDFPEDGRIHYEVSIPSDLDFRQVYAAISASATFDLQEPSDLKFEWPFSLKITSLLNLRDQKVYDYVNGYFFSIEESASPIPEPSTISFFLLSSLFFVLVFMKKKFRLSSLSLLIFIFLTITFSSCAKADLLRAEGYITTEAPHTYGSMDSKYTLDDYARVSINEEEYVINVLTMTNQLHARIESGSEIEGNRVENRKAFFTIQRNFEKRLWSKDETTNFFIHLERMSYPIFSSFKFSLYLYAIDENSRLRTYFFTRTYEMSDFRNQRFQDVIIELPRSRYQYPFTSVMFRAETISRRQNDSVIPLILNMFLDTSFSTLVDENDDEYMIQEFRLIELSNSDNNANLIPEPSTILLTVLFMPFMFLFRLRTSSKLKDILNIGLKS